jgi:hypothetical protein
LNLEQGLLQVWQHTHCELHGIVGLQPTPERAVNMESTLTYTNHTPKQKVGERTI